MTPTAKLQKMQRVCHKARIHADGFIHIGNMERFDRWVAVSLRIAEKFTALRNELIGEPQRHSYRKPVPEWLNKIIAETTPEQPTPEQRAECDKWHKEHAEWSKRNLEQYIGKH